MSGNHTQPTGPSWRFTSVSSIFQGLRDFAWKHFGYPAEPGVTTLGQTNVAPGRVIDGRLDNPTPWGMALDTSDSARLSFSHHRYDHGYAIKSWLDGASAGDATNPVVFISPDSSTSSAELLGWASELVDRFSNISVVITKENQAWFDALDSQPQPAGFRIRYIYAPDNAWSFRKLDGTPVSAQDVFTAAPSIFNADGSIETGICQALERTFTNHVNDPSTCAPLGNFGRECLIGHVQDTAASVGFTSSTPARILTPEQLRMYGTCGVPYAKLIAPLAADARALALAEGYAAFLNNQCDQLNFIDADLCHTDAAAFHQALGNFTRDSNTTLPAGFLNSQKAGHWKLLTDQSPAALNEFKHHGLSAPNGEVFGLSLVSGILYAMAFDAFGYSTNALWTKAQRSKGCMTATYMGVTAILGLGMLAVSVGGPFLQAYALMGMFAAKPSAMIGLASAGAVLALATQVYVLWKGMSKETQFKGAHEIGLGASLLFSACVSAASPYAGLTTASTVAGNLMGVATYKVIKVLACKACAARHHDADDSDDSDEEAGHRVRPDSPTMRTPLLTPRPSAPTPEPAPAPTPAAPGSTADVQRPASSSSSGSGGGGTRNLNGIPRQHSAPMPFRNGAAASRRPATPPTSSRVELASDSD